MLAVDGHARPADESCVHDCLLCHYGHHSKGESTALLHVSILSVACSAALPSMSMASPFAPLTSSGFFPAPRFAARQADPLCEICCWCYANLLKLLLKFAAVFVGGGVGSVGVPA